MNIIRPFAHYGIQTIWITMLITIIPGVSALPSHDGNWTLNLTGEHESTITQEEYGEVTNNHRTDNHFASVVDHQGQVWDGMPLWQAIERVDETYNKTTDISNNTETDASPSTVTITGTDGQSVTLPESDIIGNNRYILAGTKNGKQLVQSDRSYPLVFTGRDLSSEKMIIGVSHITVNLPENQKRL